MRKMKDSKIEWVGEVPDSWDNYKLKNLIAIHFSGNWGVDPVGDENDLLCIRVADFDFGNQTIKMSANTLRHYTYSQANRLLLQDGDLLLEKSGGGDKTPVGRVVMFEKCRYNGSTIFANFSECLRVNEKNVARYIAYYLKALYYNCNLRDFFTQTTGLQNLNLFKYLNVKTAMPIKDEQQLIAIFLDRKCGKIDGIKADIEAQIETLEKYKRSVITEAVTHGLNPVAPMKDSEVWYGQIPQGWTAIKGKYIFTQRNERGNHVELQLLSPTQKYGVIPQDLYEELSGMNAVKLNDNTNFAMLKTIHKGDYCISLRSFQGGFEYSEYEGVVSPAYQVFYPIASICSGYYKYLFKETGFIDVMNSYTISLRDGKNIAFDDFGNTYIPVPPLSEQQAIADYLDEKCAQIDALISQKQSQIETLETYKKSLIFEYVTGKKEVV